jgi:chromosome segregation ATPase
MKTKTIMAGFVVLLLMLFSFSFALAENETDNVSGETPVLISAPPDVEINNISEEEATGNLFWKKADIWFTLNQEKKAEKELRLAELQLVRARVAAKNKNINAMENALEAHRNLIEKVQNRISKFEDKNSAADLKNSTNKLVGLQRAIEVHELRIERLNVLLNNSNLSADEIANIQARIDQAESNTQHLKDVTEAQRKRNELKLKAMNKIKNEFEEDDSSEENETEDELENETEEEDENEFFKGSNGSGNGKN